jgi:hypothetical protein
MSQMVLELGTLTHCCNQNQLGLANPKDGLWLEARHNQNFSDIPLQQANWA